jgi:hypothetical protein
MKRLLLVALVALTPITASAQQFQAVANNLQPMAPLPPIASCSFSPFAWCVPVQQSILTYNQYVSTYNQVLSLYRSNSQYLLYPQTVSNNSAANLQQLISLYNQSQALSWTNTQQDAVIQKTQAGITAAVPPEQVDQQLNQQMLSSISTTLQGANLITTEDAQHQQVAQQIATAAANAKSPTQLSQMIVAILSVMSQQLSNLIQVDMLKINAEEAMANADAMRRYQAEVQKNAADTQAVQQLLPTPAPSP